MPQPNLEQSIVSLIAAGDVRAAAEQLVVAYGSEVLGRCANLVGDRFAAEDLAQDVFSRAIAGLAGFRGEATLRTWLFMIVRNVCIDHHRRMSGGAGLRDEDADAEEQPEERPFLIELMTDREQLGRALDALEETERALVILRYVHGLGYSELAQSFGIKEGAARMRLCRALGRMREELTPVARQRVVRMRTRAVVEAPPPGTESVERERLREELDRITTMPLGPASGSDLRAPTDSPRLAQDCSFVIDDSRELDDTLQPLGRALGLMLIATESRPPVTEILRKLRPLIDGLAAKGPPARAERSWLRRLFGRV